MKSAETIQFYEEINRTLEEKIISLTSELNSLSKTL